MNFLLYLSLLQQTAAGQTGKSFGGLSMIIPMVAVLAIMYLLIIRPQRKKQKETESMLKNIKKGDKVTSIGGIKGVVHLVKETTVIVKVDDNTKLEFAKSAIASVDIPKEEEPEKNEAKNETTKMLEEETSGKKKKLFKKDKSE